MAAVTVAVVASLADLVLLSVMAMLAQQLITSTVRLFAVEFFVEQEDEEVDIDLCLVKHWHDGDALVLEL